MILSIDPGLSNNNKKYPHGTGVALLTNDGFVEKTLFIPGDDKSPVRFKETTTGMVEAINAEFPAWPAYKVVVERTYMQGAANRLHLMYLGVLDYIFGPCDYITPKEVKKLVTGNGNATKSEIKSVLQIRFAHAEQFKRIDWSHDDCIDAVAIGLAYLTKVNK